MIGGMERLRSARAISWRTILGLVLVPITAAGVLLWGLWNPTDRLDTMTAAVVNLDEPVEIDGQLVPLGRVLAAELIAGDADTNFTWLLTDESDAEAGLTDGRYVTVITIPEHFSAAATSFSSAAAGTGTAETATVDIETSDRGRLLDSALSNIVTATATTVLNKQLGAQYVGGVFVGMTELGKGISEAADGARQLADGSAQLADGGAQLADGAAQLADGSAQLASGGRQLADGSAQLADGSAQLAAGGAQLADGADQLAAGTAQLSTGATGLAGGANELAAGAAGLAIGARQAAQGGAELSDGVAQYTGMVNTVVGGVIDNSAEAIEPLTQVRDLIASVPPELWPADAETTQEQAVASVQTLIDEFTAASSGSDESQLVQLRQAGDTLAAGTAASAAGQVELADGLDQYAAGAGAFSQGVGTYAAGVAEADAGVAQLAGGLRQAANGQAELASGQAELASGQAELASGQSDLARGQAELASGQTELADGQLTLADGQSGLADGLRTAANEVPAYTTEEAERMAEVAVAPVSATGGSDELFNAAGVPLFAGIALWAGAFASFLLLAPLWHRTREAARGIGFVTLRSAVPALAIGSLQGAVAGVVLPLLLGYDATQWFGFFMLALLAGVSFSLVNQGLSALFGGFGRFIAFALLVIAFAIGVISTAPPLLQAIGDASPIGALFAGFQAVAMHTSGVGNAAFVLILWGLGGLALVAFAASRARRSISA